MEAKPNQLSELTEELQQPLQLTADVDSFGDELESKLEDGEVEEKENSRQWKDLHTSFQLGKGRRQDRFLEVIDDEIILTSKRSPFRKIIFTLNRWAHLMSYLKDIDTTVKYLDYGGDENNGRRRYTGHKHLGDGYYIRVLYRLHRVDFRIYYVPYGYKVSQIRPSTNGISIRIDEWQDLIENVIPAINERFPQFANAKQCTYADDHLGQLGWLRCSSCFPFGHDDYYY